ncbi:hypothetical protein ACJ72_08204 [Emergomyces africanus]|uniref:Uncharacterized protein n=1 Tax=Emergomyces africanus TaxID=1955775 RepID=A0A1B7NLJ2_9EURO|nr:hypothetical protein ACJ72_08204 [Emergomyces africanus]
MDREPRILRPRPRKPFELASSADPSEPPTPVTEESNPYDTSTNAQETLDTSKDSLAASRTRSILNLTSSTLLGIYSPSTLDNPREDLSPWDTSGAQTPRSLYTTKPTNGTTDSPSTSTSTRTRRYSTTATRGRPHNYNYNYHPRRHTFRAYYLPLLFRSALLFIFGVAYGTIITHLHDNPRVTPIKIENIDVIRRGSWVYMLFWGAAGVALGGLLPWFDVVWEEFARDENGKEEGLNGGGEVRVNGGGDLNGSGNRDGARNRNGKMNGEQSKSSGTIAGDWNQVVRSIGAFVGIAFAIVSFVFF